MTTDKVCKDCAAEWAAWEIAGGASAGVVAPKNSGKRPAPHPGPRCATHWREERKRRKAAAHESYVGRTYNLGDGAYEALFTAQNGTCAICHRANGRTRRLSVDHDHACCDGPKSCGECVRGLICRPCNDMLGHARDQVEMFQRAIEYLQRPPYEGLR